jgi:hypothetical protein
MDGLVSLRLGIATQISACADLRGIVSDPAHATRTAMSALRPPQHSLKRPPGTIHGLTLPKVDCHALREAQASPKAA